MSQVRSAAPAVDQPTRRPAAAQGGGRTWWELAVVVPLAAAPVPAGIARHDLKQYTAEAFMARLRAGPP
jgi:hypothetical protein